MTKLRHDGTEITNNVCGHLNLSVMTNMMNPSLTLRKNGTDAYSTVL